MAVVGSSEVLEYASCTACSIPRYRGGVSRTEWGRLYSGDTSPHIVFPFTYTSLLGIRVLTLHPEYRIVCDSKVHLKTRRHVKVTFRLAGYSTGCD
jgi:hypothetical protein